MAILVLKHEIPEKINSRTGENFVQIVNLPNPDDTCPKGKNLVVSGWGADAFNTTRKTERLWALFQECLILDKCACSTIGEVPCNDADMRTNYLCVGDSTERDNNVCHGDSGGLFS